MDLSQLEYTKSSNKPFDQLVQAIQDDALARGFRTLHIHDVKATLKDKGFEIGDYSIIEVCNAKYAFQAISAFKPIGMMLPCRIVVYADGGENKVMLMRPSSMNSILPDAGLGTLPDDVEATLKAVVDEVTSL
ncbi:MAG: DUF302 domain-containing protein [Bacteroidia bacterium]|nr:DUF302 domain-containing protein [Bacteroidia bacterium]